MSYIELYNEAFTMLKPQKFSKRIRISETSCAILAENGKIYSGINLNASCGLSYCAETSAISAMLNDGIITIKELLVMDKRGKIITPCGSCLELITQISPINRNSLVWINQDRTIFIKDLYPIDWKTEKDKNEDF